MKNNKTTIEFILGRRDQKMTRVSFSPNDTKRAIKLFKKNTAENESAENFLVLLDERNNMNVLAKSPFAKEFYFVNGKSNPFYKIIPNLEKFLCSHSGLYNIYISGSGNTCVAYPVKRKKGQKAFIFHRFEENNSWSPDVYGENINYDLYYKSSKGKVFIF